MVCSHWLSPGLGLGWIGCKVLCKNFHTAPEQGQWRMDYVPIFQVLKLFQVVCFNCISMGFRCLVLVPDTASVITPYGCSENTLEHFRSMRQYDVTIPETLMVCSHVTKFSPIFYFKYRSVVLSIMGDKTIQPIIQTVTIDTMLNWITDRYF